MLHLEYSRKDLQSSAFSERDFDTKAASLPGSQVLEVFRRIPSVEDLNRNGKVVSNKAGCHKNFVTFTMV